MGKVLTRDIQERGSPRGHRRGTARGQWERRGQAEEGDNGGGGGSRKGETGLQARVAGAGAAARRG